VAVSALLSGKAQDCLFLALVVLFSSILYVPHLGFYSDDWQFLRIMKASADQSLLGLFRSMYDEWMRPRPVQVAYLAVLYRMFGSAPFGYHVVNTLVLTVGVVTFYLVLRELNEPRMLAIAVPAVYSFLPHYSTNRLWVSAFQITLSMTLFFLSLYADLRAAKASSDRSLGWRLIAVSALVGSVLAYEIFLPLFLFSPILVWYSRRERYPLTGGEFWRTATFNRLSLIILILLMIFKAYSAASNYGLADSVQRFDKIARKLFAFYYSEYDYGLNVRHALAINFGDYGLRLPHVIQGILSRGADTTTLAFTGVIGIVAFSYLYHVARRTGYDILERRNYFAYVMCGLVVFGLGYATFLFTTRVQFTPTGIGNRTTMAAAVGVALFMVGAAGLASGIGNSRKLARLSFCLLLALSCTSGYLINNTIASFWIAAYRAETEVLADIRERVPKLPARSTLFLDGVCPYIGPAIVFESSWDLAGSLAPIYSDQTLRADVVTPRMNIGEDGIRKSLYGVEHRYPYDNLFVYHFGQKSLHRLNDASSAHAYFHSANSHLQQSCPQSYEGHGVRIF